MHLRIDYWQRMLYEVYDASHAHKVLTMLADGVRVGRPRAAQVIVSPNWPSALEHGVKVADIIAMDLSLGRLHGPYTSPPYQAYIVSPLGAFKKRDSEKIRLIHDLSYPAQGSVNSLIDPSEFSLKYASVDDAVAFCNNFPNSPLFMSKLDLQDAFKYIAIHPDDWHLMGFSWPDGGGCTNYYFSRVLSFGLRSAPALFDVFASALLQFMFKSGAPRPSSGTWTTSCSLPLTPLAARRASLLCWTLVSFLASTCSPPRLLPLLMRSNSWALPSTLLAELCLSIKIGSRRSFA